VLKKRSSSDSLVDTKGNERGRTEGAVCSDLDALLLNPLDQSVLLKVGVKFDWGRRRTLVERLKRLTWFLSITLTLENGRLDLGIGQEVHDELDVEVGDTNVASNTVLNQLLEFGPALVKRGTVKGKLLLTRLEPTSGVSGLDSDVLQRNGD
jgi:hypothetical protein